MKKTSFWMLNLVFLLAMLVTALGFAQSSNDQADDDTYEDTNALRWRIATLPMHTAIMAVHTTSTCAWISDPFALS